MIGGEHVFHVGHGLAFQHRGASRDHLIGDVGFAHAGIGLPFARERLTRANAALASMAVSAAQSRLAASSAIGIVRCNFMLVSFVCWSDTAMTNEDERNRHAC